MPSMMSAQPHRQLPWRRPPGRTARGPCHSSPRPRRSGLRPRGTGPSAGTAYWVTFGIDRKDRFEIVILSACWIALIANGVLLAVHFRGRLKTSQAG